MPVVVVLVVIVVVVVSLVDGGAVEQEWIRIQESQTSRPRPDKTPTQTQTQMQTQTGRSLQKISASLHRRVHGLFCRELCCSLLLSSTQPSGYIVYEYSTVQYSECSAVITWKVSCKSYISRILLRVLNLHPFILSCPRCLCPSRASSVVFTHRLHRNQYPLYPSIFCFTCKAASTSTDESSPVPSSRCQDQDRGPLPPAEPYPPPCPCLRGCLLLQQLHAYSYLVHAVTLPPLPPPTIPKHRATLIKDWCCIKTLS